VQVANDQIGWSAMEIETPLSSWDGELTCVRYDSGTGAWFLIAVHSTRLGPAAGGTRAMTYPSPGEAAADATRLAGAMTLKMAAAGLPMGGGKSVIGLPVPRAKLRAETWRQILDVHASNLQRLHGDYWTGPDVGTNSADMDYLRKTTDYAFGRSVAAGGSGSSAGATALGVFAAIRASVDDAGLGTLAGCRVLVQGLGAVGARVAEMAVEAGAELLVADIDPKRCDAAQARGARVVNVAEVTRTSCEVLVPCATGGLIDAEIAETIPCSVVAGAANNLLRDAGSADVLAERGIVYAPDFVANAGGAIHLVGREVLGWTAEQVNVRTLRIGQTLKTIFENAHKQGVSNERAACDLAASELAKSDRCRASRGFEGNN